MSIVTFSQSTELWLTRFWRESEEVEPEEQTFRVVGWQATGEGGEYLPIVCRSGTNPAAFALTKPTKGYSFQYSGAIG